MRVEQRDPACRAGRSRRPDRSEKAGHHGGRSSVAQRRVVTPEARVQFPSVTPGCGWRCEDVQQSGSMVAVAQRPERRIVSPKARGRPPSATPLPQHVRRTPVAQPGRAPSKRFAGPLPASRGPKVEGLKLNGTRRPRVQIPPGVPARGTVHRLRQERRTGWMEIGDVPVAQWLERLLAPSPCPRERADGDEGYRLIIGWSRVRIPPGPSPARSRTIRRIGWMMIVGL